jgi:hypothetical protein
VDNEDLPAKESWRTRARAHPRVTAALTATSYDALELALRLEKMRCDKKNFGLVRPVIIRLPECIAPSVRQCVVPTAAGYHSGNHVLGDSGNHVLGVPRRQGQRSRGFTVVVQTVSAQPWSARRGSRVSHRQSFLYRR